MRHLLSCFFLLLLGTSFGQFTENVVSIEAEFGSSTLMDLDNDGDLDFIASTASSLFWVTGKLYFRTNDGNGNFSEIKFIPNTNGNCIRTIIAIDIDNDGLNDLVTYDCDYNFRWRKNLGNNNYNAAVILFQANTSYILRNISAVDIDNDGDKDIIGNYSNSPLGSFCWYENLGNSTFGNENSVNTGTTDISMLKIYDLNQDGLPDILYASMYKIACAYNQGAGVFGPEILIANTRVTQFFAFDNDNDNDLDVGYLSHYNDNVLLFENINSSSFGAEQEILPPIYEASNVINTDIDNDGDQDIVATKQGSSVFSEDLVYYENQGGGIFSNSIILNTLELLGGSSGLEVLDIDNDGQDDICIGSLFWFKKLGLVNFSTIAPISVTADTPFSSTVADFNGDGKVDIATAAIEHFNVAWYHNMGNNIFGTTSAVLTYITNNRYIKHGDLNNDGLQDIITNKSNTVGWLQNMGGGDFYDYSLLFTWNIPNSYERYNDFEIGDIDNDGNLDIVVYFSSGLKYLKNLGNNNFASSLTTINSTSSSYNYSDITLSDINDDGLLDIVYTIPNAIVWQENIGNGSFGGEINVTSMVDQPRAVSVADIDNDGLKDIVSISYNDNKTAWYKNLGGNQFGMQQIISTTIGQPTELATGDLNGDNLIDIITGNEGRVYWIENIGNGQFSNKITIIDDLELLSSIVLAETDGDGDLDIVITTMGDDGLRVLSNNYVHDFQVTGRIFYDKNQNGIFDNNDSGIPNSGVLTNPNSSYSFSYANGFYNTIFNDTIGMYDIFSDSIPYWSLVTVPTSYQVNVTSNFTSQSNLDFGFYPNVFFEEVTPLLIASAPNCNDTVNYWVNLTNSGTLKNSGIIELKLDPLNNYYSSSNLPDSIVGNSIYWHYDSLEVLNQLQFNVEIVLPDFQSMGNELVDSLIISTLDANGNVSNQFEAMRNQILTCAYDPNDKTVYPKGTTSLGYIPTDTEWLEYIIRFQNTGTNTAKNVRIDDVLDNNIERIVPLSSSHDVHITVDENNMVSFMFDNINLPDSNSNMLGSQGYVAYKVKLKSNLIEGTQISNVASIYFDYNPAIVTNTVINTLHDGGIASVAELKNDLKFRLYPNPFNEMVTLELIDFDSNVGYYVEAYDVLGQKLIGRTNFESNQIKLFKSELGSGVIYFKLYDANEKLIQVVKSISYR